LHLFITACLEFCYCCLHCLPHRCSAAVLLLPRLRRHLLRFLPVPAILLLDSVLLAYLLHTHCLLCIHAAGFLDSIPSLDFYLGGVHSHHTCSACLAHYTLLTMGFSSLLLSLVHSSSLYCTPVTTLPIPPVPTCHAYTHIILLPTMGGSLTVLPHISGFALSPATWVSSGFGYLGGSLTTHSCHFLPATFAHAAWTLCMDFPTTACTCHVVSSFLGAIWTLCTAISPPLLDFFYTHWVFHLYTVSGSSAWDYYHTGSPSGSLRFCHCYSFSACLPAMGYHCLPHICLYVVPLFLGPCLHSHSSLQFTYVLLPWIWILHTLYHLGCPGIFLLLCLCLPACLPASPSLGSSLFSHPAADTPGFPFAWVRLPPAAFSFTAVLPSAHCSRITHICTLLFHCMPLCHLALALLHTYCCWDCSPAPAHAFSTCGWSFAAAPLDSVCSCTHCHRACRTTTAGILCLLPPAVACMILLYNLGSPLTLLALAYTCTGSLPAHGLGPGVLPAWFCTAHAWNCLPACLFTAHHCYWVHVLPAHTFLPHCHLPGFWSHGTRHHLPPWMVVHTCLGSWFYRSAFTTCYLPPPLPRLPWFTASACWVLPAFHHGIPASAWMYTTLPQDFPTAIYTLHYFLLHHVHTAFYQVTGHLPPWISGLYTYPPPTSIAHLCLSSYHLTTSPATTCGSWFIHTAYLFLGLLHLPTTYRPHASWILLFSALPAHYMHICLPAHLPHTAYCLTSPVFPGFVTCCMPVCWLFLPLCYHSLHTCLHTVHFCWVITRTYLDFLYRGSLRTRHTFAHVYWYSACTAPRIPGFSGLLATFLLLLLQGYLPA